VQPVPKPTRRRALFAVAGILAGAAGVASFYALFAPKPGAGVPVLALSLPDVAGREQALEQWRGKVLVVNFWATWCAPCREEIPDFVRLQDELGAKGLQFVGIAIDQADKVGQFQKEFSINYPLLIGGYGAIELSRALGNRLGALPFTALVGRDGDVAHVHMGPLKEAQLRALANKLL
jgi:thiol-disulfide isomerase/thioredoxin